jgi:hypothetical protein
LRQSKLPRIDGRLLGLRARESARPTRQRRCSAGQKNEKDEKEGEEKERRTPPKKIEGLGDDAYWASNRFGGILYVLKGEAFISISVGGADSEQVKIDKSKTLAKKAIEHL